MDMPNPLIRRLRIAAPMSAADLDRLSSLCRNRQDVPARTRLIRQGDPPRSVRFVLSGMAYRHKSLPDGSRSIIGYLFPGDFCDLHVAILGKIDHSITTCTPSTVVDIPQSDLDDIMATAPDIVRAFWWATLVDEATLREWLTRMGRRRADRQMAHLFCEAQLRLAAVGLAEDNRFFLPLIQEELADTLGISTVHANRVVQKLREDGLVDIRDQAVAIPDLPRLREFAEFDPAYLHLSRLPQDTGPIRQGPAERVC
ncbi:Crp/Fnr family transcriptional regulator [Methylobrevis pamukkalensis]|nr:Crp/Fnr family transcriptional regulator [Methylobrevis pamukkalensis]